MNKMKAIRIAIAAILLTLINVTAIALPVSAQTTYTSTVNGIEVFPGYKCGDVRYGATFVSQATGELSGALGATINYTPNSPVPNGINTIVGGYWSLAVKQSGKIVGLIAGKVTGGNATWTGGSGTDTGKVLLSLSITGGTGIYKGIHGTGSFNGQDSHLTMPPTVTGTLQLTY